jgi:hypothetical protein
MLRELALGFGYWLAFVLVLEPDNILRAVKAGGGVSWTQELVRLTGAGLLGACATPAVLWLVRRFPVARDRWLRRAAVQIAGALVATLVLIGVSAILATAFLGDGRPLPQAATEELIANGPLVACAVVALMAMANVVHSIGHARGAAPIADDGYLTRLPIKTRGRVTVLDLDQVDWIETQGNYLALHVGGQTHLIRESLTALEPRLDPHRFARVHRRAMVAVDRIEAITALGAGDATLRLRGGAEVRLSRGYRGRLGALLD